MRDFQKLAKKRKFNNDNYPFSIMGLRVYKLTAFMIKLYIIFQVLKYVILKFVNLDNHTQDIILSVSQRFTWLIIILICMYLIVMLLRSRNHERQILINDFNAKRLRRRLLKQMEFKRLYKDEKRKISNQESQRKNQGKGQKGGSRSKPQRITKSDKMKMKSFKIASKLKVYKNTRTSFSDSSKLETQTRIVVPLPYKNTELTKQVKLIVQDLGDEATQSTNGKTDFGKMFISTDHKLFTSRGVNSKKDKYYYEPSKEDNLPEVSESTYSLSLFPDKSEDNAQKREDAEYWVSNMINRVKTILKNAKFACTYYDYQINSTVARLTFEIAEDNESVRFDKLPELLNQSLGTKGCDIEQEENYMHVMIPLPKRYSSIMDMATLYSEVFNKEED